MHRESSGVGDVPIALDHVEDGLLNVHEYIESHSDIPPPPLSLTPNMSGAENGSPRDVAMDADDTKEELKAVVVKNLSRAVGERHLRLIFEVYGEVLKVELHIVNHGVIIGCIVAGNSKNLVIMAMSSVPSDSGERYTYFVLNSKVLQY